MGDGRGPRACVSEAWRSRITGYAAVAPSDLLPNTLNWRTHPSEQQRALAGALAEVGWVTEVIVNQTTGRLVDGHLRVELALERKEPTVPVTYVELTEAEEGLVLATLDPIGAMAAAEEHALETLLASLDPADADLRAFIEELARGQETEILRSGLVDPDDVPDVPEAPWVERGELYRLGDHRLLCGDATDADDVARVLAGVAADIMWTDPPYGVGYQTKLSGRKRSPGIGEPTASRSRTTSPRTSRGSSAQPLPWRHCVPAARSTLPHRRAPMSCPPSIPHLRKTGWRSASS